LRFGLLRHRFFGGSGIDIKWSLAVVNGVLHDRFVWVSSQPHCYALSIHHHHWTNHLDQWTIDSILKSLQRG